MSWHYHFYRRRRYYNHTYQPKAKFFYSEKDFDFSSDDIDYEQFLLQEFFTADTVTKKRIFDYYLKVYGKISYSYLERTYSSWANGNYHLTDLMRDRLARVMLNCMDDESKYKLGSHQFLKSIKQSVKSFQDAQESKYKKTVYINNIQDLFGYYEHEFDDIQNLTGPTINYKAFSNEEAKEALDVSRYILEIKLQQSLDHVIRDLNIFLPYMHSFRFGSFSAKYHVSRYNMVVEFINVSLNDILIPQFISEENIESNNRFKKLSDKYLAWELISIRKKSNEAKCNSFLNENDIKMFVSNYEDLAKGDNKVNMQSSFQGEGGVLNIDIQLTPLKLLKTAITISSLKLIFYICVSVILEYFLISNNHYILGIILGIVIYHVAKTEKNKISSLIKEIDKYNGYQ